MGLINAVDLVKKSDISNKVSDKQNTSSKNVSNTTSKNDNKQKTESTSKQKPKRDIPQPKLDKKTKSEIDSFFSRISGQQQNLEDDDSKEISLFDYDIIPVKYNPLSLFNFAYSCMRFEVFRTMKPIEIKTNFFDDLFNYRIYFTSQFKFISERLLFKRFRQLIRTGELFYVEETFPIIYKDNRIIFCIDKNDDLFTEYIIKMYIEGVVYSRETKTLIFNRNNPVDSFQTIILNSYDKNEISDVQTFTDNIYDSLVEVMNNNFNKYTREYDPNYKYCKMCPYKQYCEKYPQPVSFSI